MFLKQASLILFIDILTEKGLSLIRFSIISHTLLIEIARMMGTVNAYIENR
jgi:hypothetical protein bacD2_10887